MGYEAAENGYEVATVDLLTIRAPGWEPGLELRVYMPKAEGRWPVVIFSHGTGADRRSYWRMSQHWAGHGYVCVHLTHSKPWAGPGPGKSRSGEGAQEEEARKYSRRWIRRTEDVRLVVDWVGRLGELGAEGAAVAARADAGRIGVAGQCYGAATAQLVAGARMDGAPGYAGPVSLRDERVGAVVLMSPVGRYHGVVTEAGFAAAVTPSMTLTGSLDFTREGHPLEWREEHFRMCGGVGHYLVNIRRANRYSFSGVASAEGQRAAAEAAMGGDQAAIFEWCKAATLAFWDERFKGWEGAGRFLREGGLATWSGGEARVEFK